jgi:hypothetical protein
MLIMRFLGTFAIIPTTLFLTMSFFVLLAAENIQHHGLKLFGYFVAALLCLTAVLMLFTGIYVMVTGRSPLRPLLQHVSKSKEEVQNL